MKYFIIPSSAAALLLCLPVMLYLADSNPNAGMTQSHAQEGIFSAAFPGLVLAAQDWDDRPSRPSGPPRPPRSRDNHEPLPPIEVDYDRPIDLHSPPGFTDPGNPSDNPETPVPLPGVVWLMLAGGAYAVRKLRKQSYAAEA